MCAPGVIGYVRWSHGPEVARGRLGVRGGLGEIPSAVKGRSSVSWVGDAPGLGYRLAHTIGTP